MAKVKRKRKVLIVDDSELFAGVKGMTKAEFVREMTKARRKDLTSAKRLRRFAATH